MTKLAKHIRQRYHHVRELYEYGAIMPQYIGTKDQIADVMTKGLGPADHLMICRKFMYLPDRRRQDHQPKSLALLATIALNSITSSVLQR